MVFSYSLSKRYHQRNGHLVAIINSAHFFFLLTLGARSSLLDGLFSSGAEQGLLSSCSVRASHCRARALQHSGFSSCSSWAVEHRLSRCGTQLSCSVACRIFPELGSNVLVPWPGIEPGPPVLGVLGALSLSHWATREVLKYIYF